MALPSVTSSSRLGATTSRSLTSMPSASSTSPTVPPMADTSRFWPSTETVTSWLMAL